MENFRAGVYDMPTEVWPVVRALNFRICISSFRFYFLHSVFFFSLDHGVAQYHILYTCFTARVFGKHVFVGCAGHLTGLLYSMQNASTYIFPQTPQIVNVIFNKVFRMILCIIAKPNLFPPD